MLNKLIIIWENVNYQPAAILYTSRHPDKDNFVLYEHVWTGMENVFQPAESQYGKKRIFLYVQFMSVHVYWSRSSTYTYLWLPLLSIELFPYIHTVSRFVYNVCFDYYLERFNRIRAYSTELIKQSDRQKTTSRHTCGGGLGLVCGGGYTLRTYKIYVYIYIDQKCIYGNKAVHTWNAKSTAWLQ